jgi:cobyric acid synthase
LVCLNIEKITGNKNLLKEFIEKMENSSKQHVINESRIMNELKQPEEGLTLA